MHLRKGGRKGRKDRGREGEKKDEQSRAVFFLLLLIVLDADCCCSLNAESIVSIVFW